MHPWRARLDRWFTPIARRLPVSPNAVTLAALALNLTAAAMMYLGSRTPLLFLASIAFLAAGGFADALDGIVARLHGKQSRLGDFLDHFCDRVSDLTVAAGWMLGSGVRAEFVAVSLVAVALNGYIGTQIEATWRERNYESIGRGEFVLALVVFPIVSYILAANGWQHIAPAGLTIAEWLTVLLALFAFAGTAQRFTLARSLERSE
ncbi:MAG TPA: CDP-alcohol phosphatidyltransferase family protein [Thermoanaerobaculia bacterium]|nr:CDP-alcohol phosphatidyltransferase family protein [Thermoanaerobaculia bacterium]